MVGNVHLLGAQRKPKSWFMTAYNTRGQKVNAVLQKAKRGTEKRVGWRLLLPGGGLILCPSKRAAVATFEGFAEDYEPEETDEPVM